jgi:Catalase-related immune-responsive/C-terminal domain found in long catalases
MHRRSHQPAPPTHRPTVALRLGRRRYPVRPLPRSPATPRSRLIRAHIQRWLTARMNVDRAQLAKRSGNRRGRAQHELPLRHLPRGSHDTAPTLRRLLFSYDRSARETSVRAPSMSVPSSAFSAGLLRRSLHAAGDVHRSLTAVERAHVAEAFTFQLGKVYEESIKERELQVLANVDADIKLVVLLHEAYRHCKPLGAWGDGVSLLDAAGIERGAPGFCSSAAIRTRRSPPTWWPRWVCTGYGSAPMP